MESSRRSRVVPVSAIPWMDLLVILAPPKEYPEEVKPQ